MERIRILLADDHALFREGLASILASQPDMVVVGEAGDGVEALVKARELHPDLILLDIGMPGGDGLEALRQLKAELPETTVVMLTVQDDQEKLFEAIKYGAQGYLLKSIQAREMMTLLRGAMRGEAAMTPALAGRMLVYMREASRVVPEAGGDAVGLTSREQEVLSLVAQGASDKKIAETLCVSVHTVKSHMRSILAKLHVRGRREAARLALRNRIV